MITFAFGIFIFFAGHGILEFSTEKAGQDVTPMNLDFEDKRRSTTLNSITGNKKHFFACFQDDFKFS